MKDEKKVGFTQKRIENAVKKLPQKEDIYESDLEKIKYLRIGGDWYQQAEQDISLFVGLEVLRTQGAEYKDMTFVRTMPLLRVWEVAETRFVSLTGMDDLVRLKQLCCWLD